MAKNKKKINRFVNYWRGDESLTFSFWVVYFIGLSVLSAPLIYMDMQGEAFIDSLSTGMVLLFLIATVIFYSAAVYVYVGLYRSASKYILEKMGVTNDIFADDTTRKLTF